MGTKGTFGDMGDRVNAELEGLGGRLMARTLALAEGAVELTEDQLRDLVDLTDDAALALAGDERAKAHLEAQFRLQAFSAEARAYMESAAFREAFADAIEQTASTLLTVGSKAVGEVLVALLRGALS